MRKISIVCMTILMIFTSFEISTVKADEPKTVVEEINERSDALWENYQKEVENKNIRPLTYNDNDPATITEEFKENEEILQKLQDDFQALTEDIDALEEDKDYNEVMNHESYTELYKYLITYRQGDTPTPMGYLYRFGLYTNRGNASGVNIESQYYYKFRVFTKIEEGNKNVGTQVNAEELDGDDYSFEYKIIIKTLPGYKFPTSVWQDSNKNDYSTWYIGHHNVSKDTISITLSENNSVATIYARGPKGDNNFDVYPPTTSLAFTVRSLKGTFPTVSGNWSTGSNATATVNANSGYIFPDVSASSLGVDSYVRSNNNQRAVLTKNNIQSEKTVSFDAVLPTFQPRTDTGILGYSTSKSGTYNLSNKQFPAGSSQTLYVKAKDNYLLPTFYSSTYVSNYQVDPDRKTASFTLSIPYVETFQISSFTAEPKAWLKLGDSATPDVNVEYYSDENHQNKIDVWTDMLIDLTPGTDEPAEELTYYVKAVNGYILQKSDTITTSNGVTFTYLRTSPDGREGTITVTNITGQTNTNYVGAKAYKSYVESYLMTSGTGMKFYKVENADGTFDDEITADNKVEDLVGAKQTIYIQADEGTVLPGNEEAVKERNQFDGHTFVMSYQVSADRKKAVVVVEMQTEEVTLTMDSFEGYHIRFVNSDFPLMRNSDITAGDVKVYLEEGTIQNRYGSVLTVGDELIQGEYYFSGKDQNVKLRGEALAPNLIPITWSGNNISNIEYKNPRSEHINSPQTMLFDVAAVEDNDYQMKEALIEMTASDFMISTEETKELLVSNDLKERLKQYAKANVDIPVNDMYDVAFEAIDSTQLQAKQGSYPVTFSSLGVSKTITVKVKNKVIVDEKNEEQIGANDITMSKEEAAQLLMNGNIAEELIRKADASAISTVDGSSVAITHVEHDIKAEKGTYSVSFATEKGTSVSVKAAVTDQSGETTITEKIEAYDFMIPLAEVEDTIKDNKKLIELGQAKAMRIEDDSEVEITKVSHDIKAERGIYNITYATENNTAVSVNVLVADEVEVIDPYNKETIRATDFALTTEEASILLNKSNEEQKSDLLDYGKASAESTVDGAAIEITDIYHTIEAKRGIYKVRYRTHKGTEVTVWALVSDKAQHEEEVVKEKLTANDFTISVEEAKELSDEKIISYANAKLVDLNTGKEMSIETVEHDIKAEKGVYDVTFTSRNGTKVSVKATIKDASSEIREGERIYASDFMIKKSDVNQIIGNDAKVIELGKARAEKIDSKEPVTITKVNHNIKAERGIYTVEYATASGTSVRVYAVVADTVEESANEETIQATDFALTIEEADDLLHKNENAVKKELIRLGNASAKSVIDDSEVEISEVIHTIKAERGIYSVRYATEKGTGVTIRVLVGNEVMEEQETKYEQVSANNFTLSIEEAKEVNDEKLIQLANAEAIDKRTGESLKLTVVHAIKPVKDDYEVIFKTENGTQVTVIASVRDSGGETIRTETISARDFMLKVDEVEGLSDAKIIELAQAKAEIKESGEAVEITKVSHTIKAKRGVYQATFETQRGTSISVNVLVGDEVINEDTDNQEIIRASDFMMSVEEAAALLGKTDEVIKQELIRLGKASALSTIDNSDVEITEVRHDIKDKRGIYEVSYATEKGTSVTIRVMVGDAVSEETQIIERITANDFLLSTSEAMWISDAEILRLSKAQAMEIGTGKQLELTIKHAIKGVIDTYPVTFSTKQNTNTTVTANVLGNVYEDPNTKERIAANNIELSYEEAKSLLAMEQTAMKSTLIEKANAKAYSTETGKQVEITSVEHGIRLLQGTYPVTFTTDKGTSITIQATEGSGPKYTYGYGYGSWYGYGRVDSASDETEEAETKETKKKSANNKSSNNTQLVDDANCYQHYIQLVLLLGYVCYMCLRIGYAREEEEQNETGD